MNNIKTAFAQMKDRNWDKIYWAIDLHNTIIPTCYDSVTGYAGNKHEFFPYAKEVLRFLSSRSDMILILWTSSFYSDVCPTMEWMKSQGIFFDYFNENPEVNNLPHAQFDRGKFYFNILLDDKANFSPNEDWSKVLRALLDLDCSIQ